VAALLSLVALAPSARASDSLKEPIGWSADEQRFVVRIFDYDTGDDFGTEEPPPDCPGYVDHKGEKFRGSLRFELYEKGKKVATFPIQDSGKCTPPKKARERLTQAKAALLKQGIDLAQKQPGSELKPDDKEEGPTTFTVKEGPGAPYTLEAQAHVESFLVKEVPVKGSKGAKTKKVLEPLKEDTEESDGMDQEVHGTLVVSVRKGEERRELVSHKFEGSCMPVMSMCPQETLERVWLSPGGKTAVLIGHFMSGSMRARVDYTEILGAVSWEGTPLVLR
jgi:hypothetical protein